MTSVSGWKNYGLKLSLSHVALALALACIFWFSQWPQSHSSGLVLNLDATHSWIRPSSPGQNFDSDLGFVLITLANMLPSGQAKAEILSSTNRPNLRLQGQARPNFYPWKPREINAGQTCGLNVEAKTLPGEVR